MAVRSPLILLLCSQKPFTPEYRPQTSGLIWFIIDTIKQSIGEIGGGAEIRTPVLHNFLKTSMNEQQI